MPKLKMTDAAIQRVTAAPGERTDYFDDHRDRQRGLVLRVAGSKAPDGAERVTRTWAVLCRVAGAKKLRRFTIGDYPTFSLARARDMAGEIVRAAKRGVDTGKERKAAALAAELAGRDTIEALADDFIARHLQAQGRSENYIQATRSNFDNHILPRWRGRNIKDITRRDVTELLDSVMDEGSDIKTENGKKRHLAGGPISANRVLATIRALLNWAVRRGVIETNPASLVIRPGRETQRERTLAADEAIAIWTVASAKGYPFGLFFMLALATGQRRDEVAGMRWDELDEKEKTWTLPPERTKGRREHVIPLSPLALATLKRAREASEKLAKALHGLKPGKPKLPPYVFTTNGETPISGYGNAKADLDKRIATARKKAGVNDVAAWTIHDLRRTCASGMAALGVDRFVIARVLNHADRSVTGIYDRHSYLPEKRHALDIWARYLDSLINPAPDNVASFAKRRRRAT